MALDGTRVRTAAVFATRIAPVQRCAQALRAGRASEAAVVDAMLAACTRADDGNLWHRDGGFRSYVDVSVQAKVLRILVDGIAPIASTTPLELAAAVLAHAPDSRPGLLVRAELLLEAGALDAAVDTVQHALRVQAVCPTAQELLLRAYRAKRDAGSTDPALSIVDYDLTDRFCEMPFTHLSSGWAGSAFVCSCPAWVPFPVGNVYEAQTPDAVWNSDAAIEIRRSILDGDYSYCSRTQCSFLLGQALPSKDEISDPLLRGYIDEHVTRIPDAPRLIELNHDPTCNLACPSCRTAVIGASRSDHDLFDRAAERVLLPLMKRMNGQAYISGGGEALSSRHYRAILGALNRRDFPDLRVLLITNGLLITPKRWASLPELPDMLSLVQVSIDAARPETYAKLRRPGNWDVLERRLAYLAELRRTGDIPALGLNFVVQKDNFREMLEFVDLGIEAGADMLWFQRLVNYGSYDAATFSELDVCSPAHPDHPELLATLRELRKPDAQRPRIDMNMLLGLLPEFVASDETMLTLR